jgi:hypothetical protein
MLPMTVTLMAVVIVSADVSNHARGWITPLLAGLATLVGVGGASSLIAVIWKRSRASRRRTGN